MHRAVASESVWRRRTVNVLRLDLLLLCRGRVIALLRFFGVFLPALLRRPAAVSAPGPLRSCWARAKAYLRCKSTAGLEGVAQLDRKMYNKLADIPLAITSKGR